MFLNPTNLPLASFLFTSLIFWLNPLFPLFISLPLIHHLLPLAFTFQFFLPSPPVSLLLSAMFSRLPVVQRACRIGPGPPGFHSNTLCPDVISIDGVQLGQAILAQNLFTVYHTLIYYKGCVSVHNSVCLVNDILYLYKFIYIWR